MIDLRQLRNKSARKDRFWIVDDQGNVVATARNRKLAVDTMRNCCAVMGRNYYFSEWVFGASSRHRDLPEIEAADAPHPIPMHLPSMTSDYITIGSFGFLFAAFHMRWNATMQEYDVHATAPGKYHNRPQAVVDGKRWSQSEQIELRL